MATNKMRGKKEKNIFVFGDSCVQGFWDSKGGWATRLKQYFDASMAVAPDFPHHGFYHMVFPLGVSGDTTKSILKRFEFETEKRMGWETAEEIFIFSIGVNDVALLDLAETERNIREIIKRAKGFSKKIVFLEVGPVDERLTKPVAWNEDCFYENKKIEAYNKILKKIAKENKVELISLFDEWKKINYRKLLADGIHPNDRGHKYIFEKVRDFLLKKYF
jgi:acyl-CoA thioesterase I